MKVSLNVYQDGLTKGYQLSIDDDNGGYRISGPKFVGQSRLIIGHVLNERDADRIRQYLDKAFPPKSAA